MQFTPGPRALEWECRTDGSRRESGGHGPRSVSLSQVLLLQMSDFDPHNVEATLSYEIESPRLQYEHGGEAIDKLLNGYFDPEGGILKQDCVPNEEGISSMEEAIQEARKGHKKPARATTCLSRSITSGLASCRSLRLSKPLTFRPEETAQSRPLQELSWSGRSRF